MGSEFRAGSPLAIASEAIENHLERNIKQNGNVKHREFQISSALGSLFAKEHMNHQRGKDSEHEVET